MKKCLSDLIAGRRTRIPRRVLIAAIAAVASLSLLSGLGGEGVANPASKGVYWGAQIGSQLTGAQAPWDMTPVTRFSQIAGKGLSLVEFAAPFSECHGHSRCSFTRFPQTPLENIRSYGAIPVFGWSSASTPTTAREPAFRLADVIAGRYDAYIREWATAAREWGHPFFLRFDWEMNGNWFPWSAGANGNTAAQYVAAWRHVHDIFTSVGATNVSWVWCPNVDVKGNLQALAPLYPGNSYVDWTGLDGFNFGSRHNSSGWLTFSQVYGKTYDLVARKLAPSKPMLLAEIASNDQGGSKSAWIEDMFRQVRTSYPRIRGLVWLDANDRGLHWPIESSGSSRRAFRVGVSNPAYRANLFAKLSAGPIQPPR